MKLSEKIILFFVVAYSALHLLILFQIVPFIIVWGGRIKSEQTMYLMEGFAFLSMLFLGSVILMKNNIVKPVFTSKTIRRIHLVFALFFIMNTIGNLLAETFIEKIQSIITLYLAITLFILSKQRRAS